MGQGFRVLCLRRCAGHAHPPGWEINGTDMPAMVHRHFLNLKPESKHPRQRSTFTNHRVWQPPGLGMTLEFNSKPSI